MAVEQIYTKARVAFLSAQLTVLDGSVKLALVTAAYTPAPDTDEFLDVLAANIIGTPAAIPSPVLTEVAGEVFFNGAKTTIGAVPAGSDAVYVVVYGDTGAAATSRLIWVSDQYTGLPFTPTGADVDINPNANGFFSWSGCP